MIEDPSIELVAKQEAVRIWDRIEAQMRAGVPFFTARERILAEEIRDISKAFGSEVGKRVTRAVESRPPKTVSKQTRRAVRERDTILLTAATVARKGRLSWMDKICLKLFGVAW